MGWFNWRIGWDKNASAEDQCFLFSRIFGYFTPKIIYFHYLKKCVLDQSIQKNILFILKKEELQKKVNADGEGNGNALL